MIDLRETKRIKEALAKNPNNYQSIISNTKLAVCITDAVGNFVAVNDNYVSLYNFSREELIGHPFTMVVPPENREYLQQLHNRFIAERYEILRRWVVQNKTGENMEIFVDAGYNDQIKGTPHKITFIQFQKKIDTTDNEQKKFANTEGGSA